MRFVALSALVVGASCVFARQSNVNVSAGAAVGRGSGAPEVILTPFSSDPLPERESFHFETFWVFASSFRGGVRVATGDVNGDGVSEIVTGAGPGGASHVKVFDGKTKTELKSFLAYPPTFTGGVFVASGDVNGDGFDDIITGAGAGASGGHVKVFDGSSGAELRSFFAFGGFSGGVVVASGDVNGDGRDDIVVGAGAGGGPQVKVFSGTDNTELRSFFAYPPTFTGGVYVAAGDVNGDGFADIITGAGAGAGPHVKVFDGASGAEHSSFFVFDTPSFSGGVRVAAGDVNGDGLADIVVTPGPGFAAGGPNLLAISGLTLSVIDSIEVFDPQGSGLFVASAGLATPRPPCPGDADGNGVVNFADITSVLANFNAPCR